MSRPDRPDPSEEVVPGSSHTGALPYPSVHAGIVAAVAAWSYLRGFTYSPKSDLVFDVESAYETLALFRELVRGNRHFRADLPLYLIAVTDHVGIEVDDTVRAGYEEVAMLSNQPVIGYWVSDVGTPHLDAVLVAQFIRRERAIALGKKYGQKGILAIKPNGRHEHIDTDQEHVRPQL